LHNLQRVFSWKINTHAKTL